MFANVLRPWVGRGLVVMVAVLVSGTASAQETPPPTAPIDRPWAVGVSPEEQATALGLFQEATGLLTDAFFTKAIEKYAEALTHWDHPAIHFNMAKALMNLEKPVEAYTHLKASLKYGGAPLDADQIDQVNRYMKLLFDAELAELVIEAKEQDAIISLNGVELFKAPGRWEGIVKADKNTILATKPGFQPAQEQRILPRGQKTEITLNLIAVESVTKYTRVMDAWKPWVVVGAGAAALIAGGIFTWQASDSFAAYDDGIEVCNAASSTPILNDNDADTGGDVFACKPNSALKGKKSSGETFNTLATVSYIAGGATLATGIVLLIINRERPITVEVPVEDGGAPPVTFVPLLGPDGAGMQATVKF